MGVPTAGGVTCCPSLGVEGGNGSMGVPTTVKAIGGGGRLTAGKSSKHNACHALATYTSF
eukprot:scaffold203000_cov21-Tisochrysis_lutea.AAC.1